MKALRRPTAAAWAVNLLAVSAPQEVAGLDDLRTALVKAQRQVLSGVRADLAGLTRTRRDLVERLADAAVARAADAGRDVGAQREAIRLTFEAAVADPDAAQAVRGGRLAKPLPAPAGFGTLAGLTALPDPSSEEADPPPRPSSAPPPAQARASGTGGAAMVGTSAAAEGPRPVEGSAPGAATGPDRAEVADAAARRDQAQRLRDRMAVQVEQAVAHARQVAREADRLASEVDAAAQETARRRREADAAQVRAAQAETAEARAREAADLARGRADRAAETAEEAQAQLREADALLDTLDPGG